MMVHISCLLWNSTRSSCRDAGGRIGDGGRRIGETGMEEVRLERKEEARQSRRRSKGKKEDARQGGEWVERVRHLNGAKDLRVQLE